MSRRKRKRNWFWFLALGIGILLSFLIGEASLRMYGFFTGTDFSLFLKELKNPNRLPGEMFEKDELLLQRLLPSAQVIATTSDFSVVYRVNSQGLRDKEYSLVTPPGTLRVLSFGDSFVFGEGIPYGKRFTDIPEEDIEGVEIINFGVPGFGLDQSLIYYAIEGGAYGGEYVFLFVTEVSMVRNLTGENWRNLSKTYRDLSELPYIQRNDSFYLKDQPPSYLFSFMKYHWTIFRLKGEFEDHDEQMWISLIRNNNETPSINVGIKERTIAILQEFDELTKENNSTLIIIKIDRSKRLGFIENAFPNQYIDLQKNLTDLSTRHSLRFKYDPHYNERTHHAIGMELVRIIEDLEENSFSGNEAARPE